MIKRKLTVDDKKEEAQLEVYADFEPFALQMKATRKEAGKGFSKGKTLRHVGSIPITLLMSLPPEIGLGVLYGDKAIQDWLFEKYPWLKASEGEL